MSTKKIQFDLFFRPFKARKEYIKDCARTQIDSIDDTIKLIEDSNLTDKSKEKIKRAFEERKDGFEEIVRCVDTNKMYFPSIWGTILDDNDFKFKEK